MADASVQESRERVKAALRSCGFTMPASKVVVNLAPGTLRKTGTGFDLPIAAGILCATGQVDPAGGGRGLVRGGSCRWRVRSGRLPACSLTRAVREAVGLRVGCRALGGAVRRQRRGASLRTEPFRLPHASVSRHDRAACQGQRGIARLSRHWGHSMAKRALQIAAAGGHGVLMMGPPGSGKTMGLEVPLHPASFVERRGAFANGGGGASVAGKAWKPCSVARARFEASSPATLAGLVGGGSPFARAR